MQKEIHPKTKLIPTNFDVITITKNSSQVIEKTLLSVSNQTYSYINHIIIDGNSKDGTDKIVQNFNHQKNLEFYQQNPQGIANAFNAGLNKSFGNLVLFLNSGDTFTSKDVIAKIVNDYSKHEWLWATGETISVSRNGYLKRHIKQHSHWNNDLFLYGNPICHQSTIYSQELLSKLGLYDETLHLGMDYEFNIRASLITNPYLLYFPVSYYDTSGISSIRVYKSFNQHKKIRKKYFVKDKTSNYILDSIYLFKTIKRSLMIPFKLVL